MPRKKLTAGEKAAKTRKKNIEAMNPQQRAWVTRRRREAARKAWDTRRKNAE